MKTKTLAAAATALSVLAIITWLSASSQGREKTYELRPEITLPEYRTDAARAIDAYERLTERYMQLNEQNLIRISTDIRQINQKLNSIDIKLTELSAKIAEIEKTLGIENPKPADENTAAPQKQQKTGKEPLQPQ